MIFSLRETKKKQRWQSQNGEGLTPTLEVPGGISSWQWSLLQISSCIGLGEGTLYLHAMWNQMHESWIDMLSTRSGRTC